MATSELKDEREQLQRERIALRQQQQENLRQHWLVQIYQKTRDAHGRILKPCEANEALLSEYVGLPINLAVEAVQKSAGQFVWSNLPASKSDPKQLERDRETLAQAAREYRTFGASEANLALCRDLLSPGFSEYTLLQSIRSNAIRLAAPSYEERQQWLEEDADKERLRLMNTPAHQLKQEAAEGIVEARARAAQAQADYEYGLRVEAEKQSNFPPLPEYFDGPFPVLRGLKIDRKFFFNKNVTREVYKFLHSKYGGAAVEARIREGVR